MPTQYELLTGRRVPSNAAASIQARIPLLYQQRQQKADTAYQDKTYAQNERALAQQVATDARTLDLAEQAQEQQREAAERARKAGVAGLGIQLGTGIAEYGKDFGSMFGIGGDDAAKMSGTDSAKSAITSGYRDELATPRLFGGYEDELVRGSTGAPDGFSLSDMGSKALSALTSKNTLAGLAVGPTLGPVVGEAVVPFGGSNEKEIVGAGLTGGLTSALLSGGNLYEAALGGLGSAAITGLSKIFKW